MFPDLWRYGGDLPLGAIGRRRFGVVRYPASGKPSQPAAVRLAALIAAPAFASHLGGARRAGYMWGVGGWRGRGRCAAARHAVCGLCSVA